MLLLNLGVRGGEAEVGGVAHAAVQLQRLLVQLVRLARGLERAERYYLLDTPYSLFKPTWDTWLFTESVLPAK